MMKVKCEYSKIVIPYDFKYAEIAAKYTGAVAQQFGFVKKDVRKIMRSTVQAVSWVIDYSLDDWYKGAIDISCEIIPEGFKLVVMDKGLPFDPSSLKEEKSARLLKIFQLKEDIDEILFHNLGADGKEIVLIKYSEHDHITECYNACKLERNQKAPQRIPDAPLNIGYTIRSMEPEDAIAVTKCIYRVYGYTYSYDHVYYPDKLIKLNNRSLNYSAVAATETNEIVGHCALQYENKGDCIAELALGVVAPQFRSRGCFHKLTEFLIQKAKSDQLMGIYAQAVTNHTHSQQVAAHHNLRECAILLAYIPTTVNFMGMNTLQFQRISVVFCFMRLGRSSKGKIYPPHTHQNMILNIYKYLDISIDLKTRSSSKVITVDNESVILIRVLKSINIAKIRVERYGQGVLKEIKTRLRELCLKKIEAIYLYLDLADPLTAHFSEKFEKLDFFFAGILPGAMSNQKDALILQYLNNAAINYEEIVVKSGMATNLLDYIKERDPNC